VNKLLKKEKKKQIVSYIYINNRFNFIIACNIILKDNKEENNNIIIKLKINFVSNIYNYYLSQLS